MATDEPTWRPATTGTSTARPPCTTKTTLRPFRSATAVPGDRKSTRLNSSHANISYAVFCLKKKNQRHELVGAPPAFRGGRGPVHSVHRQGDALGHSHPRKQRVVLEHDAALGARLPHRPAVG